MHCLFTLLTYLLSRAKGNLWDTTIRTVGLCTKIGEIDPLTHDEDLMSQNKGEEKLVPKGSLSAGRGEGENGNTKATFTLAVSKCFDWSGFACVCVCVSRQKSVQPQVTIIINIMHHHHHHHGYDHYT